MSKKRPMDQYPPVTTPEQQAFKEFLCKRYHKVETSKPVTYNKTWCVVFAAVDEQGETRGRYLVRPDGRISGAYDPEFRYEEWQKYSDVHQAQPPLSLVKERHKDGN